MTLHVLWKLKPGIKAWDEQYAYVKGYILALEDVLGDIDLTEPSWRVVEQVREILTSAKLTLTTLERMEEQGPSSWKQFSGNLEPENQPTTKDDDEPGKHGEMGQSPGDVPG